MPISEISKYNSPDSLSATFAALADPTRRAILDRLSSGGATVNELAAPFNLSLPTISKHLKVLEHAGLISRERRGQYRPCQIETEPFEQALTWIDEHHRKVLSGSLDHLGDYLKQMQANKERKRTS